MIFATRSPAQQAEIDNPLAALICFLEIFSEMNWNAYHVTASAILSNTPENLSGFRPSSPHPVHTIML